MAKKKAPVPTSATLDEDGAIPVVGMREPCPCGSGRRYKACHGRTVASVDSTRPFEGFASEADIVVLRELVPSATVALTLRDSDRKVTLATVLPMAHPGLVRADGEILLGLQVNTSTGNASRDLALALHTALDAEPSSTVGPSRDAASPLRLQQLVETDQALEIDVHSNFDYWVDAEEITDEVKASLEAASAHANPTQRLTSVESAYWTQMGEKEHLRWGMLVAEEPLLNALARLQAAGESSLGEGTTLVGMFRAQGIIIPVWDLPLGFGAAATEAPAAAFLARLNSALDSNAPLTDTERRARALLITKQVTLRD
ncbi:MAG: DUF5926 family protein [Actinomycetota bacterium]|nr:DUF5926 family protein [Actinomycetota bacterium]MDP2287485.1 DUF5926 family protein [Actinomycetota bacterium]